MPPLTPIDPVPLELKERGVKDGASPTDNFEIDATSCTREYFCKWTERYEAVKFLVGYSATYLDGAVTKISRLPPHRHPYLDGLYATKVTNIKGHKWDSYPLSPRDDETRVNVFDRAVLTVLYEHVPFSVVADADIDYNDPDYPGEMQRYVEQPTDIQPSGEYLQMPGATMRFIDPTAGVANGKPIPVNSGKVIPQETFHVVWHRVPENVWAPGSVIFDRVYVGETDTHGTTDVPFFGAINRSEFIGRPVGTVMLNNVMPRKRKSPTGVGFEWDITFEFIYKPSGWNWLYFFNPGTVDPSGVVTGIGAGNGWYFVGTGTTHYTADTVPDNYSLYNARDLRLLFDPDS